MVVVEAVVDVAAEEVVRVAEVIAARVVDDDDGGIRVVRPAV